jgi:PhzF family phenazine biosynthesis protein
MLCAVAEVLRYTAFSADPAGGNPAGVVLDAAGLDAERMLAIAAEVGYSETAFLVGRDAEGFDIRYYTPLAEVAFCGHATVATAVALAERDGPGELVFRTLEGPVPVTTARDADGALTATLTSVGPRVEELEAGDLAELLAALRWSPADLDPELPPRVAYAGVHHPVLGAATRERLAALDYDFDRMAELMRARGWTTIQLVWREAELRLHSRNPFAVAGIVEDPATGAAAAAFGNYLRDTGNVTAPATVTVHQGVDMGRPSLLTITIDSERPEIRVSGRAVAM